MKTDSTYFIIASFLLVASCETDRSERSGERDSVEQAGDALRQAAEAIDHEAGQAEAKVKAARDEFVQASRRRLDEIDNEMKRLHARAKQEGKEFKSDAEQVRKNAAARLETLERRSDKVWENAKGEVLDGLESLERTVAQARENLSDTAEELEQNPKI